MGKLIAEGVVLAGATVAALAIAVPASAHHDHNSVYRVAKGTTKTLPFGETITSMQALRGGWLDWNCRWEASRSSSACRYVFVNYARRGPRPVAVSRYDSKGHRVRAITHTVKVFTHFDPRF